MELPRLENNKRARIYNIEHVVQIKNRSFIITSTNENEISYLNFEEDVFIIFNLSGL